MKLPLPVNPESELTRHLHLFKRKKHNNAPFDISEIHSFPAHIMIHCADALRRKNNFRRFSVEQARAAIAASVNIEKQLIMATVKTDYRSTCTCKLNAQMETSDEMAAMLATFPHHNVKFNMTVPEQSSEVDETISHEAIDVITHMMAVYMEAAQENLEMLWKCDFSIHRMVRPHYGQTFRVSPGVGLNQWEVLLVEQSCLAPDEKGDLVVVEEYVCTNKVFSVGLDQYNMLFVKPSPWSVYFDQGEVMYPHGLIKRICRSVRAHMAANEILNTGPLVTMFAFPASHEDLAILTFVQNMPKDSVYALM